MIPRATIEAMRRDRAEGHTLVAIAARYGVTRTTVARHTDKAIMERNREYGRQALARLKADTEKYAAYKARQVEKNRAARLASSGRQSAS